MAEFLTQWISQSLWVQIAELGLLVIFFAAMGAVIVRIILNLRKKNIDPTITFTKEGLQLGTQSSDDLDNPPHLLKKEDLTPMEQKLFEFFEARDKSKESEISQLKAEVNQLRTQLQALQLQLATRQQHEEDTKTSIIPITQHIVFSNLKIVMERGVDFPDKEDDHYRLRVQVAEAFIKHCRTPVLYDHLKKFIDGVYILNSDQEKMAYLFNFSDCITEAITEYSLKAHTYELKFEDGTCVMGIPDCFIEKFSEWSRDHVDIAIAKIKQILYSSFYRTWQIKLIASLEIMDMLFTITTNDIQLTVDSLNGEVAKEIQRKIELARCS